MSSFKTHCTLPEQAVSYVSSPDVRSTLDILWSSTLTIVLCTWTVLHLNIPRDDTSASNQAQPDNAFIRFLRWVRNKLSGKPKWMAVTIILPEFLVAKSMAEFIAAWRSSHCDVLRQRARESGYEWTMTHAFYANMGGFILVDGTKHCCHCRKLIATRRLDSLLSRPQEGQQDQDQQDQQDQQGPKCHHGRLHSPTFGDLPVTRYTHDTRDIKSFFLDSPSHNACKRPTATFSHLGNFRWDGKLPIAVQAHDLCALLSNRVVKYLPTITKDEIKAQSKEDTLVKVLALLQILWLIVQLIARRIQSLPSTQLEIATLGYAVCTFATYCFWFHKPKDLVLRTEVMTVRKLEQTDISKLTFLCGTGFFNGFWEPVPDRSAYIPNDQYNGEASLGLIDTGETGVFSFDSEDIGMIIGAVVFASAHLIAWSFQFPTPLEQMLWRVATLITMLIIPVWYVLWVLMMLCGRSISGKTSIARLRFLIRICMIFTYLVYGFCRLYMIAEMYRGLFFLQPDVFKTTWTGVLPSFS